MQFFRYVDAELASFSACTEASAFAVRRIASVARSTMSRWLLAAVAPSLVIGKVKIEAQRLNCGSSWLPSFAVQAMEHDIIQIQVDRQNVMFQINVFGCLTRGIHIRWHHLEIQRQFCEQWLPSRDESFESLSARHCVLPQVCGSSRTMAKTMVSFWMSTTRPAELAAPVTSARFVCVPLEFDTGSL